MFNRASVRVPVEFFQAAIGSRDLTDHAKLSICQFSDGAHLPPPEGPEGQRRCHVRGHDGAYHLFAGHDAGLHASRPEAVATGRSARRGRHCRRHAEHAVAEQRCRDCRRNQRLQRHGNRSSRPFRPTDIEHRCHKRRSCPHRDRFLHVGLDQQFPDPARHPCMEHQRDFERERFGRAEHQFLPAAGRLAFDGDRRNAGRHRDDGKSYVLPGRLRLRLS